MNTEITDNNIKNGWVFYDAECPACRHLAIRFQNVLHHRGFELLPLQTPWVPAKLAVTPEQLMAEMHLLRADGTIFVGAAAWLEISRHFWWTWPLRQLARLPVVMNGLHALYRWIASHRCCLNGQCQIPAPSTRPHYRAVDFVPLTIFTLLAVLLRPHVTNWIFMWLMAFGLYAGCKWLTYRAALRQNPQATALRRVGYLLAYTGMNATEFFNANKIPAKPRRIDWATSAAKIILGLLLLYGVTRHLLPAHPMLAGWTGMIGSILLLHFGFFHLLALAWQQLGVNATPLMQNPLRSTSLAEFWGRRWNTGFKELSYQLLFRPLQPFTTPANATLLVFAISGLIHELVISLPARGGYGFPTLYFLLQGLGLLAERTHPAKNIGLGRGQLGWLFTILITTGPVFWLFHPPFIQHVILPMLHGIGAT